MTLGESGRTAEGERVTACAGGLRTRFEAAGRLSEWGENGDWLGSVTYRLDSNDEWGIEVTPTYRRASSANAVACVAADSASPTAKTRPKLSRLGGQPRSWDVERPTPAASRTSFLRLFRSRCDRPPMTRLRLASQGVHIERY